MIEYVKQGVFFADEWKMASGDMQASVSARDGSRDTQDQSLDDGVFWRDYTAGQAVSDLAKVAGVGTGRVKFNDTYENTVLKDGPVQYVRMKLPITPKVSVGDWWGRFWARSYNNYKTIDSTLNPEYEADFTTVDITNFTPNGDTTFWNARFESFVTFDFSETYTISATANDGVRVYVNGTKIIDNWNPQVSNVTTSATFAATAGTSYYVVVEHFLITSSERLLLQWQSASVPLATIPATKSAFSNPLIDYASGKTQRCTGTSVLSLLTSDKDDRAIYLNGTNNFGIVNVDGLPTTQKITIEFWFNNSQATTNDAILLSLGSGSNRIDFYASASTGSNVLVRLVGATGTSDTFFARPSLNAIHHYVFQCDKSANPDASSLWVDGVQQPATFTPTVNNTDNINNGQLVLGADSGVGSFATGILDEVAVYPYLLTNAQISEHYNAGVAGQHRLFPILYGKDNSVWDAQLEFSLADFGMFYIDEADVWNYESFLDFYNTSIPQHSTVQYTLSDSQEIINGEQPVELQANKVIVNVNPVTTLNAGTQPVWRATNNESLVVTSLTASVTSTEVTSVSVKSTSSPLWKSSGYFKIDNEIIKYTSITANTLNGLTRGMFNTLAVTHSSAAKVREARVYDVQLQNAPVSHLENQPFLTSNQFTNTVDIDQFTHTPYTAHLVVSASTVNLEGDLVPLDMVYPPGEEGLPYVFELAGNAVAEDAGNQQVVQQVAANSDNIRKYKVKDLTIDNKFVQTVDLATDMATFLLARYQNPVPILELDIMCIPQLQLGDRVKILTLDQLDIVNKEYWVIASSTSYDGGAQQKVTLREVS